METILEVQHITKEFQSVKALQNVSFSIKKGEVHALVGENGAGKSTLMKVLSGVYTPTVGKVLLEGEEITLMDPKQAQSLGISIIHQEFSLIPYLNAVDNIYLGREIKKKSGLLNKSSMKKNAINVLKKLNAEMNLQVPVAKLSVAQQQFVEIAKAIAIETKVLIFDEPTASLTGKEIEDLFTLIDTLKKEGVTIIYISHHLEEILHMCDRVTCLRDGKFVNTENVSETNKQEIIKMMVGREITDAFPEKSMKEQNAENFLEVINLTNNNVKDIKFHVNKGEILGIAGLVGSGRTETVRALLGIDKTDSKEVFVNGSKVNIKNPTDALKNGICIIPENRKTQGLILDATVKSNISLPIISNITNKLKFIDKQKEKRVVEESIKNLLIKTPNEKQKVKNLSGGNQQKVVLAKWLNTDCQLLIFDEPTRGIDIGAKEEIYKLMTNLSERNIAIIMISSELPEVLGMSDRILVMQKGKINAEINSEEATSEKVMYYATGGGI